MEWISGCPFIPAYHLSPMVVDGAKSWLAAAIGLEFSVLLLLLLHELGINISSVSFMAHGKVNLPKSKERH